MLSDAIEEIHREFEAAADRRNQELKRRADVRRVDDDEGRLARAPDRAAHDGAMRAPAPPAQLRIAVVLLRVALQLFE